jgi:hypothetical protein
VIEGGLAGVMASTPSATRVETIMFRTIGDQVSLWVSLLPEEVL